MIVRSENLKKTCWHAKNFICYSLLKFVVFLIVFNLNIKLLKKVSKYKNPVIMRTRLVLWTGYHSRFQNFKNSSKQSTLYYYLINLKILFKNISLSILPSWLSIYKEQIWIWLIIWWKKMHFRRTQSFLYYLSLAYVQASVGYARY